MARARISGFIPESAACGCLKSRLYVGADGEHKDAGIKGAERWGSVSDKVMRWRGGKRFAQTRLVRYRPFHYKKSRVFFFICIIFKYIEGWNQSIFEIEIYYHKAAIYAVYDMRAYTYVVFRNTHSAKCKENSRLWIGLQSMWKLIFWFKRLCWQRIS